MSLSNRILVILLLALLILVVLLGGASGYNLLTSFGQVENKNMDRNITQAQNALSGLVDSLASSAIDYAVWDDAYGYTDNTNPEFPQTDLTPGIYTNLGLDFVVILGVNGEAMHSAALDSSGEALAPISTGLSDFIDANKALFKLDTPDSAIKGMIDLPEGLAAFAANPILTSEGEGLVSAMEQMNAVVNANNQAAGNILSSSERVSLAIQAISGITRTNQKNVEQVSRSASEISRKLSEATASMETLDGMAAVLSDLVSHFKLED